MQMQSGTPGINTARIYSPAKQALDQDPRGMFIRRWVPELANAPDSWLHQPELMPIEIQRRTNCLIVGDYPAPIVLHAEAVRQARERIFVVRRSSDVRTESKRVLTKHGRRKKSDQPHTPELFALSLSPAPTRENETAAP